MVYNMIKHNIIIIHEITVQNNNHNMAIENNNMHLYYSLLVDSKYFFFHFSVIIEHTLIYIVPTCD